MYIWKTSEIVSGIREGSVTEVEYKNYFMASTVISIIFFYIAITQPRDDFFAIAFEAIGTIVISITGINTAFKANGGESGSNFISKIVAISLPLLVKLIIIAFTFGLIVGALDVLDVFDYNNSQVTWLNVGGGLVIQAWYFWRLTFHVSSARA